MIIIVFGLPGSGKSYFAQKLAGLIHAAYINSDRVRKEMFMNSNYTEAEKQSVYSTMLGQAKEASKQNKHMVLDATFYRNEIRDRFREALQENGKIIFIEVAADETVARERLNKKRTDSDADYEVYKKIRQLWEPFQPPHLMLQSTADNVEAMLNITVHYLHLAYDNRTDQQTAPPGKISGK